MAGSSCSVRPVTPISPSHIRACTATCRQTSRNRNRLRNSAPRRSSSSTLAPTSTRCSGGTTFALSRKTASPPPSNYSAPSDGINSGSSPVVIALTSRWRTSFCPQSGSITPHDTAWQAAASIKLNVLRRHILK